jgi:hypothetical protein
MSQKELIRQHLEAGKTLTQYQALILFGCFRLASRVYDLERDGLKVDREMIVTPNARVAQYFLKHKQS